MGEPGQQAVVVSLQIFSSQEYHWWNFYSIQNFESVIYTLHYVSVQSLNMSVVYYNGKCFQ